MQIVMYVNMWKFDPSSICAVINCVIFVWDVSPLCILRIQLRYCQKYSRSSIQFLVNYDEQSGDMSSLLVMESCDQDLGE